MKNKFLILVIGESTGLECFKVLLKKKYLTISYVISVDSKYNFIINYNDLLLFRVYLDR